MREGREVSSVSSYCIMPHELLLLLLMIESCLVVYQLFKWQQYPLGSGRVWQV